MLVILYALFQWHMAYCRMMFLPRGETLNCAVPNTVRKSAKLRGVADPLALTPMSSVQWHNSFAILGHIILCMHL